MQMMNVTCVSMVYCELYADDEICDIFDPRCNHDM